MSEHSPASIAGRFNILEPIGQGAMGTVYRGVDTASGEEVAIKQLKPEVVTDSPIALDRFKHEGHTLGILNHPSIVRFVSMTEDSGHLYLITEHVPGGSLKELLAEKTHLTVRHVVEVALDLADALSSAHELGIIHRDIKPTNILFAEDGTPRLADFGVALCTQNPVFNDGSPPLKVSSAQSIQGNGERIGTLAYMSPESYRGEAVGPESDIWSLGLVMFEMLAGRLPFEDEQAEVFVAAVATRPIPTVTSIRPEIPDVLAALIRKMLENDRSRRVRDAREISAILESILTNIETPHPHDDRTTGVTGPSAGLSGMPRFATPFVGRTEERAEIERALRHPTKRLISLIGPGGIGKSRLAVETASNRGGAFRDGCYFVPLTAVSSADFLVPVLANALGFSFQGLREPKDQFLDFLRERQILLILDSFEHLLEGVDLLEDILAATAHAKLLVTSRGRLNLDVEFAVILAGLPLPEGSDESVGESGAMDLFYVCAKRLKPDFSPSKTDETAIAHICRLVEGMPLGIELAAAWVNSLSCEKIATDIGSNLDFIATSQSKGTERHRSIRAVFDHSWHLLCESERGIFRKLSAFRGGFTLDAARKVAGAALAVLSALVDKSFLRRSASGRYEIHELLRQYAEHELNARSYEQEEARGLHSEYYAGLFHRRGNALSLGDRGVLGEIDKEIDNIRASWLWALGKGSEQHIERFYNGFLYYYELRSLFRYGEETFREAAETLRTMTRTRSKPTQALALALAYQGVFLRHLGRREAAREVALEGYSVSSRLGSSMATASAAYSLGQIATELADYAEARKYSEEALCLWRKAGHLKGTACCLNMLGTVAYETGNLEEARSFRERSLEICRRTGDRTEIAHVLNNLGVIALETGDYENAKRLFGESIEICEDTGTTRALTGALNNLGFALACQGHHDHAMKLYQRSLRIRKDLGDRLGVALTLGKQGELLWRMGRHGKAERLLLEALDLCQAMGGKHWVAWTLVRLGNVALALGEDEQAGRHFREGLEAASAIGAIPLVADAVRGGAEVMARSGAEKEALKALSVVLKAPGLEAWVSEQAQDLVSKLERELPPVSAARAIGAAESESLEELAEKFLSEYR